VSRAEGEADLNAIAREIWSWCVERNIFWSWLISLAKAILQQTNCCVSSMMIWSGRLMLGFFANREYIWEN